MSQLTHFLEVAHEPAKTTIVTFAGKSESVAAPKWVTFPSRTIFDAAFDVCTVETPRTVRLRHMDAWQLVRHAHAERTRVMFQLKVPRTVLEGTELPEPHPGMLCDFGQGEFVVTGVEGGKVLCELLAGGIGTFEVPLWSIRKLTVPETRRCLGGLYRCDTVERSDDGHMRGTFTDLDYRGPRALPGGG